MALSRQFRIITLLVIDSVFFLIELITGYAVGSLALVADSFHMLNDVLSLVVALYTIKLATSPSSATNSYGWQRAEILGALINGVFLVALCVSIALEAIGRFVSPPEISNPKIIVIVGSLGLLSNIVGLFLFHEHGHSHGHSHGSGEAETNHVRAAEEGAIALPNVRQRADSMSSLYQHPAQTRARVIEEAEEAGYGRDENAGAKSPPSNGFAHSHHRASSASRRSKHNSLSRPRPKRINSDQAVPPQPGSNETRIPHPPVSASLPSQPVGKVPINGIGNSSASSNTTAVADGEIDIAVPALPKSGDIAEEHVHDDGHSHDGHDHGKPVANGGSGGGHGHSHSHGEAGGGHGHSHGSMNMRGVFLHVMGDALGNVGVISAGLIIWFCHGRWTLYFDPGVSFLITLIILHSAIPLVRSASYILLQGVPQHISLEDLTEAVGHISGVVSVHELHVWQLSESTTVASVHVLVTPESDYMAVAGLIREVMHEHGIHSVTIQPEYYNDEDDQSETACLIRCPPDQCGQAVTCCPPTPGTPSGGRLLNVEEGDEHGHEHGPNDGHNHSH